MPAAVQRLRMSPSCQCFTLRWVERTIPAHALAGVRRSERDGELAGDPESHQCERLVEAFAQRAGGIGPRAVELAGEQLQALLGRLGIGQRPCRADPRADLIAIRAQAADR